MSRELVAVFVFLGGLASSLAYGQQPITESNWQTHPRIATIRTIVLAIDSDIRKGLYTSRKAEGEYNPSKDLTREAFYDQNGAIRKFVIGAGWSDSATTSNYYYDESGILRFVYIVGGAVNGTHIQQRIYFEKGKQRIWESQKLIKGPGYTFPEEWPVENAMFDPAKVRLEKW